MSWKKGPLPPNTFNWGGVVPTDHKGWGFFFADFRGDHVVMNPAEADRERHLMPNEVAYYNNSLDLPPHADNPAGAEKGPPNPGG